MQIEQINNLTVAHFDGPIIATGSDAIDVIRSCNGLEVDVIAIPVERLVDDFFRLRTGLAGAVLQKFRNYGFRVAIIGDMARWTAASGAFSDFVIESNRRGQVLFLPDLVSLESRL